MSRGCFADRALSRRIEAAEARFTLACGQVAQRLRPATAAVAIAIGGGAAVFSGEGSPFDKVIGIGFEPVDWVAFDDFEAEVRSRGGTVQVELATRADPELARARARISPGRVRGRARPPCRRAGGRGPNGGHPGPDRRAG
jgi:hypothetical protein